MTTLSIKSFYYTLYATAMSGHGGFLKLLNDMHSNVKALVTGGGGWWAASHFIMMNGIFRLLGPQLGA